MKDNQHSNYQVFGIHLRSNYQLSIPSTLESLNPDIEFIVNNHTSTTKTPPLLVYSSPYRDTNDINHFRLFLQDGRQVLRLSSGISFDFKLPQIICTSEDIVHPGIENGLLGAVMALWLENHQIIALHASAIVMFGRSVIFLSSSLSGKSSLAATFMQEGFPLMSDDIVPVENTFGSLTSRSGYPSMRLWPDEAEFFLGDIQGLISENPRSKKLRIPVGTGIFGTYSNSNRPIRCIYLPQRYSPEKDDPCIEIQPVTPRDALIELIRYSYMARLAEATGLGPARLRLLGEIARNIPVRRLIYPSGYRHLPVVREAILKDLSQNQ